MPRLKNDNAITTSPYSIKFQEEKAKGYVRPLFKEGAAVQGREANGIIEYIRDGKKQIVEDVLKVPDGAVVGGTLPAVSGTTVTLPSDLKFWIRGEVVGMPTVNGVPQNVDVTISTSGFVVIGVSIAEYIYDHVDDPTLKDPATGWTDPYGVSHSQARNAGNPGAERIKYSLSFSTDDFTYALWHFKDGVLQNANELPSEIVTVEMFERYRRIADGDCTEKPVKMYINNIAGDNDNVIGVVNANRYFVFGKEIPRTQDEPVTIVLAKDYDTVDEEAQTFATGTFEYATNENPIRDLTDFSFVAEGYLRVTRGNTTGGSDQLCSGSQLSGYPLASHETQTRGSLLTITEVYEATDWDQAHTKNYTVTTDFVKSGNSISWAPEGEEPTGGSSYWVKCQVNLAAIKASRTVNHITNESVVIGGNNDVKLAHNDVMGIEDSNGVCRVIIGNSENGDDYVDGTDFTIVNNLTKYARTPTGDPADYDVNLTWTETEGAAIHWLITPPAGTVYVTYDYNTHTKEGHFITRDSFSDQYHANINTTALDTNKKNQGYRNYFSIRTATTEKPVNSTNMGYDYTIYRPRRDLVMMKHSGQLEIKRGIAQKEPVTPIGNERALTIAEMFLPADSKEIIIDCKDVTSLKQPNLHELSRKMVDTIDDVSNIKIKLDTDAKISRADAEKGNWFENFTDATPSKNGADLTYSRSGILSAFSYDIYEGVGRLPYAQTATDLVANSGESSNINVGSRLIKLSYSTVSQANTPSSLKQTLGTTSGRIAPYIDFTLPGPFVKLDPDHDQWINTTIIFRNRDTGSIESTTTQNLSVMEQFGTDSTLRAVRIPVLPTINTMRANTAQSLTVNNTTLNIRSRQITVEGSGFVPNANNISLTFDGIACAMTPVAPWQAGTNAGTMKADANGTIKATFTVPSGIPIGAKSVALYEPVDGRTGTARYVADAIEQIEVREVVTRPPSIPSVPRDPRGQTFIPDADYDIVGLDLFFTAKSSTDKGFITIKDVVNGWPESSSTLMYKLFGPSDVTTSANGGTATNFTFDDVVPLVGGKQYFFGTGSNSVDYEVMYAEPNKTDTVNTSEFVAKNTYQMGNMMTSSDGQTWSVHQESDLKFYLRPANYNASGYIVFDTIVDDFSSFLIHATELIRSGTSTAWKYSTDGGTTWKSFVPNKEITLPAVASQLKIKIELATTNPYVSPVVDKNITVLTRENAATAHYISRNLDVGAANQYHKLYFAYKGAAPSGCTITPYYSTDQGITWIQMTSPFQTVQIDNNFNKYYINNQLWCDAPDETKITTTPSNTGGTLAADDYYYKITATNSDGETLPCDEIHVVVGGTNAGKVTFDFATGAWPEGTTGYHIYRSTTSGSQWTLKYIGDTQPTSFIDDGSDTSAPSSEVPPALPTARLYKRYARVRVDMTTNNVATEPKIADMYFSLE